MSCEQVRADGQLGGELMDIDGGGPFGDDAARSGGRLGGLGGGSGCWWFGSGRGREWEVGDGGGFDCGRRLRRRQRLRDSEDGRIGEFGGRPSVLEYWVLSTQY